MKFAKLFQILQKIEPKNLDSQFFIARQKKKSLLWDNFSKDEKLFFLIQFFLIDEKFGSNIVEHFEGANNIGFQHNL